MNKILIIRIILDLFLLLAVISGWWIVALTVCIFSLFYFKNFFEILIFGVIFDALFGFNENLGYLGYIGTIVTVTTYIIFRWLKTILRR